MLEQEKNWSGAARSTSFLKRGGGIGGGNIPDMPVERSKKQYQQSRSKSASRKGIKELIVDHLKSKIVTQDDASKYLNGV